MGVSQSRGKFSVAMHAHNRVSPSINKQRIASRLAIRASHATACRLFINMYQRLILKVKNHCDITHVGPRFSR